MSKNNIIVVIAFLALVVLGWWFWGTGGGNTAPTALVQPSGGDTGAADTAVSRKFLATLLGLKQLNLSDAIFSDPAFTSLQDFSQPLPQETAGRSNPFAPLGVDAFTANTGEASGNLFSNSATTSATITAPAATAGQAGQAKTRAGRGR